MRSILLVPTVLMAVAACTSPPKPPVVDGRSRVPVNAAADQDLLQRKAARSATAAPVPAGPQSSFSGTPIPAASAESPPPPIKAQPYTVQTSDRTVLGALTRWAKQDGLTLEWRSDVDYPVTRKMLDSQASTSTDAIAQLRTALLGVSVPLSFEVRPGAIRVERTPVQFEGSRPQPTPLAGAAARPGAQAATAAAEPGTARVALLEQRVVGADTTVEQKSTAARTATSWEVGDRSTLRAVIEAWAKQNEIVVRWETAADYPVTPEAKAATYTGTFKEALGQLASRFGELPKPLGMKFLSNGSVLRVYDVQPS